MRWKKKPRTRSLRDFFVFSLSNGRLGAGRSLHLGRVSRGSRRQQHRRSRLSVGKRTADAVKLRSHGHHEDRWRRRAPDLLRSRVPTDSACGTTRLHAAQRRLQAPSARGVSIRPQEPMIESRSFNSQMSEQEESPVSSRLRTDPCDCEQLATTPAPIFRC
jgi:hypothetical protein